MRSISGSVTLAAMAAAFVCGGATSASAACKRMAFTVNDYGKEGPTRDAISLLDKYIADYTREKGIKKYTVGKRDVKCELYLNLIVIDEHTCKASATVCWGDDAAPGAAAPAVAPKPAPAKKPKSATTG